MSYTRRQVTWSRITSRDHKSRHVVASRGRLLELHEMTGEHGEHVAVDGVAVGLADVLHPDVLAGRQLDSDARARHAELTAVSRAHPAHRHAV